MHTQLPFSAMSKGLGMFETFLVVITLSLIRISDFKPMSTGAVPNDLARAYEL